MSEPTFFKDPTSKVDYTWDWSSWLTGAETISDATFTAAGVTASVGTHDTTTATTRVSGGTVGTPGTVTCHIVTSTGQEEDWTFSFTIKEK